MKPTDTVSAYWVCFVCANAVVGDNEKSIPKASTKEHLFFVHGFILEPPYRKIKYIDIAFISKK